MLVVITTVSALVHLYSFGYMAHDPRTGKRARAIQPRFFAYLSFFTFAMLMLVTADNLIQMFFGWEGVGVASYLLIGFYYRKPTANAAAIKAFVVNRVGDFGFALGIFGLFYFDSVILDDVFAAAPTWRDADSASSGRIGTRPIYCVPAVYRCDGQIGPAVPAHMAAGCDGGANTGFGAYSRGDHGYSGRVSWLPDVAPDGICPRGQGVMTFSARQLPFLLPPLAWCKTTSSG